MKLFRKQKETLFTTLTTFFQVLILMLSEIETTNGLSMNEKEQTSQMKESKLKFCKFFL